MGKWAVRHKSDGEKTLNGEKDFNENNFREAIEQGKNYESGGFAIIKNFIKKPYIVVVFKTDAEIIHFWLFVDC